MKQFTLIVGLLVFLNSTLTAQFFFKSEENFEKNVMVIQAEAVRDVVSDYATFNFSIRGTGSTLQMAVAEARSNVAKITQKLKEIGLEDNNLTTTYFHSGENYKDKAFLSSKKDYVAEIKVIVGLEKLEVLEPAIIEVSKFEPERLSDINFELKNYDENKLITLNLAIEKAKEKAQTISTNLGITLGPVLYVEEINQEEDRAHAHSQSIVVVSERTFTDETSTSIFFETKKIKSKVRIIFQINHDDQQIP